MFGGGPYYWVDWIVSALSCFTIGLVLREMYRIASDAIYRFKEKRRLAKGDGKYRVG